MKRLQGPVHGGFPSVLESSISLRETLTPQKLCYRQRGWVRGFNDGVFVAIDQFVLLLGEPSPEDKDNSFTRLADDLDHFVCKLLPAIFGMGVWLVCSMANIHQQLMDKWMNVWDFMSYFTMSTDKEDYEVYACTLLSCGRVSPCQESAVALEVTYQGHQIWHSTQSHYTDTRQDTLSSHIILTPDRTPHPVTLYWHRERVVA